MHAGASAAARLHTSINIHSNQKSTLEQLQNKDVWRRYFLANDGDNNNSSAVEHFLPHVSFTILAFVGKGSEEERKLKEWMKLQVSATSTTEHANCIAIHAILNSPPSTLTLYLYTASTAKEAAHAISEKHLKHANGEMIIYGNGGEEEKLARRAVAAFQSRNSAPPLFLSPLSTPMDSEAKSFFEQQQGSITIQQHIDLTDDASLKQALKQAITSLLEKPRQWPPQPTVGIVLASGSNLLARDINGKSDPYCVFELIDATSNKPVEALEPLKSAVVFSNLNPVWKETLYLDTRKAASTSGIRIQVWDKDTIGSDDKMGKLFLSWEEIKEHMASSKVKSYKLLPHKKGAKVSGSISLAFYEPLFVDDLSDDLLPTMQL